ncbi:dihydroorotase-like protein [Pseudomonas aeruginosa M8A.4]|uniref:dihydroorotase n=1 Tax=Pseudomonas aeruginosa TaxID=287 RepID=UPI0003B9728D|nr:dihydroorotase [Pseudomonas aeruginosa]ARN33158.1 dihydroorotase [Pseudomonas aeruginosa]ERX88381.1 dihydroorotase-like protein [Pseudomonas aeruginosa M8A.4]MCO2147993.1 dihydroorotase [Pseudomonas aeruginosa]RQB71930.1 dihydroorotase [Pseudomonas aeruginosa]HBP5691638.1 dihydroorotase [Pseudomonas aeruginosa]
MTISIRGARVIDPASGLDQVGDLHIEAGKIVAIGAAPAGFSAQKTLDGAGLVAAPGLVDLSVALREPGYGRKGNVESETRAAAAGGTTSLCCPPYTRPVLDTPAVAELILDRAREAANAKVYPIGALTRGFGGEQLSELVALRDTGCVAFTNGLHGFASNRILRRALEYAATFDLTVIFTSQDTDLAEGGLAHEGPTASFLGLAGIPETAETVALARNLLLVEQSGVRAHFSQLTSARGIELVAQAQARGLPVTCDVALYQLILTDEALVGFSSLYHVQPPLRTRADREALREAVKNGVVQAIASHHQPHEADAKNAPFAATEPGISGAELLLPLAMTLVQDGLLDLPTLLARLSHGPAQALRLPAGRLAVGQAADLVLFDPQGSTLAGESWYSKGQNSPFVGHCLPGRVRYTLVDGHLTHEG